MSRITTTLIGAALALTTLGAAAQHQRGDDDRDDRDDQRYDQRYDQRHDPRYDQRHDQRHDPSYSGRIATPQIDRMMAEQAQRIQWGLRSGALTHVEARHLRRQQFQIVRVKQRALGDGDVSREERQQLRELQAQAGHDIERALRNARHQDGRYRNG